MLGCCLIWYTGYDIQLHAGVQYKSPKALPAWQRWSKMQDPFSLGLTAASDKQLPGTQKQPRLQSIASATFPPQCLMASEAHKQSRHGTLFKLPAQTRLLQAQCHGMNSATRLVLNDRRVYSKGSKAGPPAGQKS